MFKSLNRKVLVSPGERALSRSDHRTSRPEETRGLVMRTDSVTESAWGPPLGYRDTPQPSRRTWRPFLPKSSVPAPRRTGPRSWGCGGEKGGAGQGDGASGPCSAPSLASCSPAPLQKWLQAVSSTLDFWGPQQTRSSCAGRVPQLRWQCLSRCPWPGDPVGGADRPCLPDVRGGHLAESAFHVRVHRRVSTAAPYGSDGVPVIYCCSLRK